MSQEENLENMVTFEKPLNEQLRICVRLEQLFTQLNEHLNNPSVSSSQQSLITLLRIVEVIDRPDLKSKLMQTLSQFATSLGQLEQFPQVDTYRLHEILTQLDNLIKRVHQMLGRFGEALRTN